jgi:hypothetical protein
MDNINEFAIDLSLQKVAEIDGHPLYTSSILMKKFINVIKSMPRSKQYANDYISLIEAKKLIPCYFTKVFLRIFEFDVKDLPPEAKHIVGFYAWDKYKAYILIDNSVNIYTPKYARFLVEVTIHELTHMFAKEQSKQFMSLFGGTLIDFYVSYFTKVFKLKGDLINETKSVINFMFNQFELSGNFSTRRLYEKIHGNFLKLTTLDQDDFENVLLKYCNVFMIYVHYGLNEIIQSRIKYSDILDPIGEVYKEVFNNNVRSIHIQELLCPSEVISILSETDKSSKYNKMVSYLANKV